MARGNPGIKNAIKSADFNPKRLLAFKDDVRRFHCGDLIGCAMQTFMQPDPSDPTDPTKMQEGLLGAFQFTDSDPETPPSRGPKLWVPDAISKPLKDALRDPETGEVRSTGVDFAFEVYAIRSSAPVGYTWEFIPIGKQVEVESDPLVRIARRLAVEKQAALTDQSGGAAEESAKDEAPVAKGKGAR